MFQTEEKRWLLIVIFNFNTAAFRELPALASALGIISWEQIAVHTWPALLAAWQLMDKSSVARVGEVMEKSERGNSELSRICCTRTRLCNYVLFGSQGEGGGPFVLRSSRRLVNLSFGKEPS